ncbi:MAG: hypothetical protein R3C19_26810 [Planctomycetaceae bacterium]
MLRLRNLQWTEAERQDAKRYRSGQVIEFHKAVKAKDTVVLDMGREGLTVKTRKQPAAVGSGVEVRRQLDMGRDGPTVRRQVVRAASGIGSGERLEVTGHDETGRVQVRNQRGQVLQLPLEKAAKFNVYSSGEVAIAAGDRIRITKNGQTADGKHRLNNGSLYQVKQVDDQGRMELQNGWKLPANFGHLAHGYVTTSHASQGRTVDYALLAMSSSSFAAASREGFYVASSRAREGLQIFTDDKESLRNYAIQKSSERMAAMELIRPPEHEQRFRERVKDMFQRATDYARNKIDTIRRHAGDLLSHGRRPGWEAQR